MQIIQDYHDGREPGIIFATLSIQVRIFAVLKTTKKQFRVVYYKTYTGSSVSKSTAIDMPPTKEILRHGHEVSWVITADKIKQKILVKTLPADESFLEWGDVIIEIIRNQREQLMMRLLKENLEQIDRDKR